MARLLALLLLAATACAPPPAAAPEGVKRNPPRVERRVEPSAQVTALLKEDPDLQATIAEDEAKATLRAAEGSQVPQALPESQNLPGSRSASANAEWERLQAQKREQEEAHRRKLESINVIAGPDGQYHSARCDQLYGYTELGDGSLYRHYFGRTTSLGQAIRQGLGRHSACNPPAEEFSYR